MGNYKLYDSNQTFFHVIDSQAVKGGNRLLRAIDQFVDKHLDITVFEAKLRNDDVGAPAVDPRIILKVLFYAFATGVRSYRKIEDRLEWDQNFLVLSCRQTFDYSTISRFIKQYGEEIVDFFSIMGYVLRSQGYVNLDFIAIDGTKIKASAGKDFTGTIADFKRRKEKIQRKVREILAEMGKHSPDDNTPDLKRKQKKLARFERHAEKINQFLDRLKEGSETPRADEKVNLTDPDARKMKDKDSFFMGYNAQLAVDGKHHLIVGFDVFNLNPDQPHLRPMIESVRKQTGKALTTNSEIAFDAGFYSAANLLYCASESLNVYIPEGQQEDGTRKTKENPTITAKDCQLLNVQGEPELVCPGGFKMRGHLKFRASRNVFFYAFQPPKKACTSCEFAERCYAKAKTKRFEISKTSFDANPLAVQMRTKVASDIGRRKRAQRFATNEHVNGDIKETMNVRRFYHRGKEKVRVIWCLTSMAYNFRRLASLQAA